MDACSKNENVLEPTENTDVVNTTETTEASVSAEPIEANDSPVVELTETAEVKETTENVETAELAETVPTTQPENTVVPVAAEASVFCSACGAQMSNLQKFCPNCGAKREANIEVNQAVEEFNKQLKENKKKKKKKILKVFAIIVAAILIFGIGKSAFVSIRHSVGLSQAETAVESYNEETIDYDEAIEKITKLKISKDAEVAAKALEAEETINELKASKDHFEKGETYKNKNDYKNAVFHFEAVIEEDTKHEAAKAAIEEIIPLWKSTLPADIDALLKDGKKEEADKLIKNFLSYAEGDKDITNISKFIEAEDLYAKGHLGGAQDIYKTLPENLKVNGITVKSRIDTLKKYAMFVKMCGKWQTTKYYCETKETWRYSGSDSWYVDGTTASRYLYVTCKINNDGTVKVEGEVEFYTFTNYSSIKSALSSECFTSDFSKTVKLTSDGKMSFDFSTGDFTKGDYFIKDNQSLSFNGSSFNHNFKISYVYSQSCTEYYTAKETFGTRVEKY